MWGFVASVYEIKGSCFGISITALLVSESHRKPVAGYISN